MTVKGNDTNDCLGIFSFFNKAGNMYSVVIIKTLNKNQYWSFGKNIKWLINGIARVNLRPYFCFIIYLLFNETSIWKCLFISHKKHMSQYIIQPACVLSYMYNTYVCTNLSLRGSYLYALVQTLRLSGALTRGTKIVVAKKQLF